ncbi:MAG: hypothetical protein AB7N71_14815 [Phycisphaerae bacterium]
MSTVTETRVAIAKSTAANRGQHRIRRRIAKTMPRSKPQRAAFSLVESVISVFLVGLLLVSALNAVGASAMTQRRMADKTRGRHLAEMMMNEILAKAYDDPNQPPSYGLESGETVANRALLDDVDDYFGYDQPVTDLLGAALPAYPGWRWRVSGSRVSIGGITDRNGADTGIKRIVVEAVRDNEVFATAIGFRTHVWDGFTSEGLNE